MNTALEGLRQELEETRLPPPRVRRELRKAAGLSRRKAGCAVGVDPKTIQRWEDGALPHLSRRRAYREFLDLLAEATS